MTEAKVFKGGEPTDIDVKKLLDVFGVPREGTFISYDDISACIDIDRSKNRWKSIVYAWLAKMDREHNLFFKAIPNEGYNVLDGSGRVDLSGRKYKGGLKKIVKASSIAARTDRKSLSSDETKFCDHVQKTGAFLKQQADLASRQLKAPDINKNDDDGDDNV